MSSSSLSTLYWLWIPVCAAFAQILIELFVPDAYLTAMHSESGPHETLQFIIALFASIYALRCFFAAIPQKAPLLTAWTACFCLGCIYIAGEEVSWGQHIFDWSTPEFWLERNDQFETNLHNTSSWLDQKPRLILFIGVMVGGLIIPALQKLKPKTLPQKFAIIYPPAILSLIAACALGTKIIDKIDPIFPNITILTRASEIEELYIFYFVLLYLVVLFQRIKANKPL